MPTIMDFYNTGLAARENQTRNKYLDPMLAAQLYESQTKNKYLDPQLQAQTSILQTQSKYLPDQYQLANQYQGLVNQYYGKNMESEIAARNMNTRYKPLETAITLQNSLRNNSRFGDASNFIRSVNSMKSGDQELYLSDPNNLAAYQNALRQVQTGISGGVNPSNIITTPDFIRQFGFDIKNPESGGAGLATSNIPPQGANAQGNMPANVAPPQIVNTPPQTAMPTMPQGGIGQPMVPNATATASAAPATPSSPAPMPMQPQAGLGQVHPAVENAVANTVAAQAPNQELSPQERQLYARQSMTNQKLSGAKLWNRAQSAVGLELYLQDNQQDFADRINNAAKYAGALGKGRLVADKLARDTPQSLIDYTWMMNDFIPNLGNNIKMMEGLASTDEQRKVLNQMQAGAFNWYIDPKAFGKLIDMNFDLFSKQAKATLKSAQPIFPGTLEKLNGIKENRGSYLKGNKKDIGSLSTDDLLKMYKEAS